MTPSKKYRDKLAVFNDDVLRKSAKKSYVNILLINVVAFQFGIINEKLPVDNMQLITAINCERKRCIYIYTLH